MHCDKEQRLPWCIQSHRSMSSLQVCFRLWFLNHRKIERKTCLIRTYARQKFPCLSLKDAWFSERQIKTLFLYQWLTADWPQEQCRYSPLPKRLDPKFSSSFVFLFHWDASKTDLGWLFRIWICDLIDQFGSFFPGAVCSLGIPPLFLDLIDVAFIAS